MTCRKRKTRCAGEKPVCSTCSKGGHVCLGFADIVERKSENGTSSGAPRNDRGSISGPSNSFDDDDSDEEEEERRHWKATAGRRQSISSQDIKTERRDSSSDMTGHNGDRKPQGNGWEQMARPQEQGNMYRRTSYPQQNPAFSEDGRSSNNRSPVHHRAESHRVPYFRYFGPTAIVPGFKQMVVNVPTFRDRERRKSRGGSFSTFSTGSILGQRGADFARVRPAETVLESLDDLPVYDPDDSADVDPLIISLVKTFFLRLGCNYPFLREERCLRMVQEKRLEPMLVDAICALAARFSELSVSTHDSENKTARSEFGHVFAQRAKAATVDTFPCPSVGAVQACLLMAYEGFGENQDSTLWMYLGLAIRMAVDLGLQKMVGVKYQGEKDPWYTRTWSRKSSHDDSNGSKDDDDEDTPSPEEQTEIEHERMDTFWAVFILDRVISSGTGRPVTFRDDDFELSLPEATVDPVSGWPAPFPHFIRIIHLYGRVSDVLNNISTADDLTEDKMTKLAQMENDLTCIHHNLDPRLVMSPQNFQEYVKAGQGTTFILLHFWIHALFVILHQPTLVMPFGSFSRARLLPSSHELSMSSAKSIADILAFAELIDPKSFIGNPFTSQPIYIAACAFVMESTPKESMPPTRETSPRQEIKFESNAAGPSKPPRSTKHLLLTSTANQNYQRCYKSLQHLHEYWGGVKYILTALEQRQKGIWDCETYTNEEWESTRVPRRTSLAGFAKLDNPASPNVVPMAFSLTGTTNSPNPSLTLLTYQNNITSTPVIPQPPPSSAPYSASTPPGNMIYDPIRQSLPESTAMFPPAYPQPNVSAMRHQVHTAKSQRISISAGGSHGKSFLKYESFQSDGMDRESPAHDNKIHMFHGNHSYQQHPPSYTPSSQHSSAYESPVIHGASPASTLTDSGPSSHHGHSHHNNHHHNGHGGSDQHSPGGGLHDAYHSNFTQSGMLSGTYSYLGPMGNSDGITLFDSHEIDIGQLGLSNDVPASAWLEYLPETVLEYLDSNLGGDPSEHM